MSAPEGSRLSPAALALLAQRAAPPPGGDHPMTGPLSFPQLTQWFYAQLHPQSAVFNLPKILTLRGEMNIDALRHSLQSMVDRQTVLRTAYRLDGAEPVQQVLASRPIELAVHDLVERATADPAAAAEELLEQDAGRPFDLTADQLLRALLIRREPDTWQLQVTFHHVGFDGWSTGIFLKELAEGYRAACARRNADLPALAMQVADVAAQQRAETGAPRFAADRRYWRERLHDVPAPELPLDFPPDRLPLHRAVRHRRRLPRALWDALLAFGRASECTPFVVFFAGWAALTARRCGQTRCLLGVAVAGRTSAEWEPLLGNFVNVLPLAVDIDAAPTFATLLAQVRLRSAEAIAHQQFPFQGMASEIAPPRRSGVDGLFPVIFNFRNLPLEIPDALPGLTVTDFAAPSRGTVAPLNLNVIPDREGGLLELDTDPDLLAAATAEHWLDGYVALLTAAIAAPDQPLAEVAVMAVAEQDQLAEWNRTDRIRDRSATLPALFARQVAATPDRIAVRAADGDLTYRQLDDEAQRIASTLRARGIGRGAIVGVCMDRCRGLIAAVVGVQQAGAAYLPIDPSNPRARVAGMLEDATVSVVIGGPGTPVELRDSRWEIVPWDAAIEAEPSRAGLSSCTSDDPAHVIFTSGSTGRPKGAVVSQSAVVNYIQWLLAENPLGASDVVLQHTSIGFDVSVSEIWAALLAGARLLLPSPGQQRDAAALVDLMQRERVSLIQLVPTLLRALLEIPAFAAVRSLRIVGCGAEVLPWELVATFRRAHDARLINLYGPTETCIYATSWTVDTMHDERPVPIGRPIANMMAYVLDPRGGLAPIGTLGELHIAGDGVALGFAGRPDLTAERFVADPFRRQPGCMMYRTGDRARWRHDGVLEFRGRLDHQIKLRGFRIELGEIEAALRNVPGVRLAAAMLHGTATGTEQLAACIEALPSTRLDPATIRTQLRQLLPDYMIPATIRMLPSLPLTPSGKIDRTSLLSLPTGTAVDASAIADEVVDTTLEYALRMIWARLLDVPQVGLDDDFFALGGHSLIAARMVHELAQSTGHQLPIATLFHASTIRTLIPHVLAHACQGGEIRMREIQRGTSGHPPFFMLTGDLTGGGFYCRGLAQAIGPDHALYAIPPAPPGSAPDRLTIEAMAATHLAEIRAVRPSGPYRLGGFCIGGLIAYEIARQLEASGERVELVLLVDSIAPGPFDRVTDAVARLLGYLTLRDAAGRIDHVAYLKQRASEVAAMPMKERVAAAAGYPARVLRRLLTVSAANRAPEGRTTGSLYDRTSADHIRARWFYRPGPYRGRVDLVRTPDSRHPSAAQLAAWRRIAARVVLETVPVGHSEVVFTHLPELLRQHLARVEGVPGV